MFGLEDGETRTGYASRSTRWAYDLLAAVAAQAEGEMRPLMASFLEPLIEEGPTEHYDERRAITLDSTGQPLVAAKRPQTMTKVVSETADATSDWLAVHTKSAAPKEPVDVDGLYAIATATRVAKEPTDDDHPIPGSAASVDDPAVGLASF